MAGTILGVWKPIGDSEGAQPGGAPPHGEAAHIVLAARAGLVAPPDDEQAVAAAFLDAYRSWEAGQLHIEPDLEVVNGFERRRLTARLAALFDQLAAQ